MILGFHHVIIKINWFHYLKSYRVTILIYLSLDCYAKQQHQLSVEYFLMFCIIIKVFVLRIVHIFHYD